MKYRLDYIARLGESASEYYAGISSGGCLTVDYAPSVRLDANRLTIDDITKAFETSIRENAERERAMETSLVGIHRDDILFTINSLPARTHGSQGEWRTAAIALKLAVYHLLTRERGFHPVLLLDEIFAELDYGRSEALMAAFKDFKQLFLTTAVEPPDFLKEGSRSYRIAGGQVAEIA